MANACNAPLYISGSQKESGLYPENMVTNVSLYMAWSVHNGISFGTFLNGFSSSLATSCNPTKHVTVKNDRRHPPHKLFTYWSIKNGTAGIIVNVKNTL